MVFEDFPVLNELKFLMILYKKSFNGMNKAQLASHAGCFMANCYEGLESLSSRGLVVFQKEGRSVIVKLTKKGELAGRYLCQAQEAYQKD